MSYSASELSVSDGQPIELYMFQQGLETWYFTSGPDIVVRTGVEYLPAAITRSQLTQSGDISKSGISLTFPRFHEFSSQFLGFAPDLVTTITIFRGHATDNAAEYTVYWKGRVMSGKAEGSEIMLECESVFSSLQRTGLRARYQRSCRHTMYGVSCGVNMDSVRVTTTVQSATANSLVSTDAGLQADGWYSGGIVKLQSGAMRFITSHVGSTIYISRPFLESIGGQVVDIFPGCDHQKSTCIAKYNNLLNFGGFPYIPSLNPFGGTSIV